MSEDMHLNWDSEMEVNLFHALRGHKPVGVNKHFHMVTIHEKLASNYKKITAKQIWSYLGELYDLNALNESEIIPFPNRQNEFNLPDEFSELQSKTFPRLKADGDKSDAKGDKLNVSVKIEKSDKLEKSCESVSNKSSLKSDSRHTLGSATPDNSPKRKRTRHTPSSNVSPATPDAPPPKRRR